MVIEAIHAFTDNFIWALRDGADVVVVDPGDAEPVLQYLANHQARLKGVLITHKHGDHIGGLAQLCAAFPGMPVYGPENEPIAALTQRLRGGEWVPVLSMRFKVMAVPGHTEGHIAYFCETPTPLLFCGDTMFSVGCGRIFSGTAAQLHASLQSLCGLPVQTKVYCAHEYTLDNIGFAKWVEPENPALLAREEQAHQQISEGKNTVPSLLADELACNPFLRLDQGAVIASIEAHAGRSMIDDADAFTSLRHWKDSEYD